MIDGTMPVIIVVAALIGLIWLIYACADRCAGCGARWSIHHRHRRKDGGADLRFKDNPLVCHQCGRIGPAISAADYRKRQEASANRPPSMPYKPTAGSTRTGEAIPAPARVPAPRRSPSSGDPISSHRGLTWLGRDSVLDLGGYRIAAPLVYVASRSDARSAHPAVIDLSSAVSSPLASDPGYWPHWGLLSPSNRGAFLAWMRDGRRTPGFNIGLVFIYFYGLERRAIVDRADLQDIHAELCGLLTVYGGNRSFHRYASSLLAILHTSDATLDIQLTLAALMPPASGSVAGLPALSLTENLIEVILTRQSGPIEAAMAAAICRTLPGTSSASAMKAIWPEFSELFVKRFTERWPHGHPQVPTTERSKIKLEYAWAARFPSPPSPRISVLAQLHHPTHWQDVMGVWASCLSDLRRLANEAASLTTDARRRFEALPSELRTATGHPDFAEWDAWFRSVTDAAGYAAPSVSDLVTRARMDMPGDGKLRPAASRQLAERVEALGFAIEPDPRVTGKGLALDERRGIYRPADGRVVQPGHSYRSLVTIVELCLAVALADGQIGEGEIEQIFGQLDRHDALPDPERERLRAHVAYQQAVGGDIGAISANRLRKISDQAREVIASVVVTVALSDGTVTKAEQAALRKIYRALALPMQRLEDLLTPAATANTAAEPGDVNRVTINWTAVEALQRETNDVQSLLGQALDEAEWVQADDDESEAGGGGDSEQHHTNTSMPTSTAALPATSPPATAATSAVPVGAPSAYQGLDPRYAPIVDYCRTRTVVTAADFRACCATAEVMPAAAMEAINAWSDETYGDFLMVGDGQDTVTINREILA